MGNTSLNDLFGNATPNNESGENIGTEKPFWFESKTEDKPIQMNGSAAYPETEKPAHQKSEKTISKINGFEPADWQSASKRARQNSVFKFDEREELLQMKKHFGKQLKDYGEYGSGIYLFFTFSKMIIFLFLALMVISLIPTIYNASVGENYDKRQNSILKGVSKASIGNLKPQGQKYSSLTDKLMNAIPAFIMSLLFFAFYLFWSNKSKILIGQLKQTTKMFCQNTVEVYKFPNGLTQEQLKSSMGEFGKITQISQVRKYNETISYCREIYKINQQISQIKLQIENQPIEIDNQIQKQKIIKQKKQKKQKEQILKKKLQKVYTQLQLSKDNSSKEIIKFFVTFQSQQKRQQVVETFLPYNRSKLSCFKKVYPEHLKEKMGGQVYVKACLSEPDGIIWQNMHVTWKTRWIRLLLQLLLIAIMIFLGFCFILVLNVLDPPITTSHIDSKAYDYITIMKVTDQSVVRSWCLNSIILIQLNPISDYALLCDKYLASKFSKVIISAAIVIGIMVVKFILKFAVVYLSKFMKYKNYSQQTVEMAKNLSVTNFFSTVFITMFMQSKFGDFTPKELVMKISQSQEILMNLKEMNSFQDTDSGWYLDVGYHIWVTWLTLAIMPPILILTYHYPLNKIWRLIAKRQLLQVNMEKYLMPNQFEISYHFSNLSVFIYVGFVLSPGMPCLIILTGFGLILRYFYLKFIFIRFSKIPKPLDESLNNISLATLVCALFSHLIMAIWMYGVDEFFDHSDSFLDDKLYSYSDSDFQKYWLTIVKRCVDSWYLFALLVFYTLYFLWFVCVFVKDYYVKYIKNTEDIKKEDDAQVKKTIETLENGSKKDVKDLQIISKIRSFKIQSNFDYNDILAMKDMKDMKQ